MTPNQSKLKVVTLIGAHRWNINLNFLLKKPLRLVNVCLMPARVAAAFTGLKRIAENAWNKYASRIEIHKGTTRTVILCGAFAYKVPRLCTWYQFLHGLLASMTERTWAGYDDRLCPIVWSSYGGWLVIMRRAEPITWRTWRSMRLQAWNGLPTDFKMVNFGRYEGRIVMVDYGSH